MLPCIQQSRNQSQRFSTNPVLDTHCSGTTLQKRLTSAGPVQRRALGLLVFGAQVHSSSNEMPHTVQVTVLRGPVQGRGSDAPVSRVALNVGSAQQLGHAPENTNKGNENEHTNMNGRGGREL